MLTYKQSTVYVSDYNTLGDRKWLNDTIIGFGYDIIANKLCADAPANSLLFVHPTTVNVIKFENDEEDLIPLIKDSGIPTHEYVFLPINNSQSMFSVSGSHWALLIYQRHNNQFYYLDSAGSYNLTYAQKFANKIYPYIGISSNDDNGNDENESDAKTADNDASKGNDVNYIKVLNNFTKLQVPQQQNNYDCGMYVIEFTKFVAKYYLDELKKLSKEEKKKDEEQHAANVCITNLNFFAQKDKFDAHYMIQMRKQWRQSINDMAKQSKNDKK